MTADRSLPPEKRAKTEFADVMPDVDLAEFLRSMAELDQSFCDAMTEGIDFTLKMEIRGCGGKLIHVRVTRDNFRRPGPEKFSE